MLLLKMEEELLTQMKTGQVEFFLKAKKKKKKKKALYNYGTRETSV